MLEDDSKGYFEGLEQPRRESRGREEDTAWGSDVETVPRGTLSTNTATDDELATRCRICGRVFRSVQGLGGHMSRAHPGESNKYWKRRMVRESRKKERELLRIAKLKFFEENGATAELTRWKIKRLKRDIRA